jgi:rhodanese-related sulfurtransferase
MRLFQPPYPNLSQTDLLSISLREVRMATTIAFALIGLNVHGAASPPPTVSSQPIISKAEKLESRIRVEYAKATKDIQLPIIKPTALLQILDDTNLVLIDIRQSNEQVVSMLPHALTTAQFAEKFRKGIPAEKKIVVYCTIGYRSGKYGETLAKQGIKSLNLEGGLLAWSHIQGPLLFKNASGEWVPTNRIHTYSKEWNLVHPDYVGVW